MAQFPTPPDEFAYDDVAPFAPVPSAELPALRGGAIAAALDPALGAGDPQLALWTQGNRILFADSMALNAAGIGFSAPAHVPYTDRDNRYAILNSAAAIVRPGQFAVSPSQGLAVHWPLPEHAGGAPVSVGARRGAFFLPGSSHVAIRGFAFTGFSARRDDPRGGAPIVSSSAVTEVENACVRGNRLDAVNGIHGNAISIYLGYGVGEVSDNIVTGSARPLTLSGDGGGGQLPPDRAMDLVMARDVFLSNERVGGAVQSFGGGVRNLTLEGNRIAGPRHSMVLHGSDANILVRGNQLVGRIVTPPGFSELTETGNVLFDPLGNGVTLAAEWASATVPDSVCQPPG